MSYWIRSVDEGTIAVCANSNSLANTIAMILDNPNDLNHSVVYNADLTAILGHSHSGSLDECLEIVKRHA